MKALNFFKHVFVTVLILAGSFSHSLQGQEVTYWRLTTTWLGDGMSLDILNNGYANRLILNPTANVSSQYWRIINLGNGHFRFTNKWLGNEKSIDLMEEGDHFIPQIAPSGNFSGQNWKISKVEGNEKGARLSTMWQGEGLVLDIVNDGKNNKPHLAPTGNSTGQQWIINKITPEQFATVVCKLT